MLKILKLKVIILIVLASLSSKYLNKSYVPIFFWIVLWEFEELNQILKDGKIFIYD